MNPKHTHDVSSPRCPLARRPVQLQPSSPLPSKGADRRLACGRLPKHAPDLTQIEKAFSKLRAQFRKEAARANDTVWRAAGHICSPFMCNACGTASRYTPGLQLKRPMLDGPDGPRCATGLSVGQAPSSGVIGRHMATGGNSLNVQGDAKSAPRTRQGADGVAGSRR